MMGQENSITLDVDVDVDDDDRVSEEALNCNLKQEYYLMKRHGLLAP